MNNARSILHRTLLNEVTQIEWILLIGRANLLFWVRHTRAHQYRESSGE